MTNCQICIIQDMNEEATHTCPDCGLEICDNEVNHILDHARIDEATTAIDYLVGDLVQD